MESDRRRNHSYRIAKVGWLHYKLIHDFEYRTIAGNWEDISVEMVWMYFTRWGARKTAKRYMRGHREQNIVEVVR